MWQIQNVCDKDRRVSITFVVKNGTGNKKQDGAGAARTETFDEDSQGDGRLVGATIMQTISEMPCNYSIGINKSSDDIKVSTVEKIDPNSSGSGFWKDLKENGLPSGKSADKSLKDGKDACVAVCGQRILKPGDGDDLEFSLVWDMPKVKFPKGTKFYSKYYTKYFGADGKAGTKILDYALKNYSKWEQLIVDQWQSEILQDEKLPDWYKSAIFNELYFIADGGSLWITVDEDDEMSADDPR